MPRRTRATRYAALLATVLLAAACGGQGDSGPDARDVASGGAITVRGCDPQQPLVPADTSEGCGSTILDLTVARLVHYNADTAAPELDIAESIATRDNTHFTVRLKPDYRFSDGTPVTARSFVDAWNYAVANALQNEASFALVQGYADVAPPADPDGPGPKTAPAPPAARAKAMRGLRILDDRTFTITTTGKVSNLPVRLGANAFAPLPDAFFKDPKGFADKPVGAGPYVVAGMVENQEIRLVKNPGYSGRYGGNVDTITFRVFPTSDAAYNELVAGNLDVIDEIPTSALVGGRYQQDLPGRTGSREAGAFSCSCSRRRPPTRRTRTRSCARQSPWRSTGG